MFKVGSGRGCQRKQLLTGFHAAELWDGERNEAGVAILDRSQPKCALPVGRSG